jgi:hypothetical protein
MAYHVKFTSMSNGQTPAPLVGGLGGSALRNFRLHAHLLWWDSAVLNYNSPLALEA